MLFPKDKLQIVASCQGKTSEEGWLVVDIMRVDMEGVSKLYIDLSDVAMLRKQKDEQAELVRRAKDLLSFGEE